MIVCRQHKTKPPVYKNPRDFYKDTPKRIIKSLSGDIVYLVEWWCPICDGNGCARCKFSGVMDGPTYATYTHNTRWEKW